MSWVATAIVGSAVIGGTAAYLGGREQANAAENAANKSSEASRYATDLQRDIYEQTREDQTPWLEAGRGALGQLTSMTGEGGALTRPFAASDFQADPGYAFRQAEGMRALERSAAARGGLLSGAALRATERFGQDLASQEYQNAFNRYQTNQGNQFNRLASLAGVGQQATNALQQAGSNYGGQVAGITQNDATNQANALLAAGNARASAYQGIGNAVGDAAGIYALYRRPRT